MLQRIFVTSTQHVVVDLPCSLVSPVFFASPILVYREERMSLCTPWALENEVGLLFCSKDLA